MQDFQAAVAPGRRRLLTGGLVLHGLGVALQWRMAAAGPVIADDGLAAAAAAGLWPAADRAALRATLSVHWALSWAAAAGLLAAAWHDMHRTRACGRVFLCLLLAHLGVCAAASRLLPAGGGPWLWALPFGAGLCLISGWLGALSFRGAAALGAAAPAAFYAAMPPEASYAIDAALVPALAVGVVGLAWASNRGQVRSLCVYIVYNHHVNAYT